MKTVAFTMKLKRGFEEEYQRRHEAIWPELAEALVEAGIRDYTIYLNEETGVLFAVQLLDDGHTVDQLAGLPVMKRWWEFMKDIMQVNPDNSPVVAALKPVFNLNGENM